MMEAAHAHGATNEHTQRLKKRVGLITEEIAEIEGGAQGQAQDAAMAQPQGQPQAQAQQPAQPRAQAATAPAR